MCSGWCNNWVTGQHARCNNKNMYLLPSVLGPVEMLGHWTRTFVLTSHSVRQNWNRSEAFRILWNLLKHRPTPVAYPVTDCRRQRGANPFIKQQHYRVEWFRQLVGGFLPRTAGSSLRPVHVELWCEVVTIRLITEFKYWKIKTLYVKHIIYYMRATCFDPLQGHHKAFFGIKSVKAAYVAFTDLIRKKAWWWPYKGSKHVASIQ